MGGDLQLVWLLVVSIALTAAPAAAAALVAVRAGARDVVLLVGVALAGSGAAAMVGFWSIYADPAFGRAVSVLLPLAAAAFVAWGARRAADRDALRLLATPALLWVSACVFVTFLGFLHGGQDQPLAMSAMRFAQGLPPDNDLPRYFADWFYLHGHDGPPPPYGDWLSSDRPPLQMGYAEAQRPFGWDVAGLHYQVICVVAQQLWVPALWAVLRAGRVGRVARGLAMIAAAVSDVAIIHGFYVWPKLLAATFVLAALAVVVSPSWDRWRRSGAVAALVAVLCGLALLSHGASSFFVLALVVLALLRGWPSWRFLAAAAVAGAVTLAPWSAYQQEADPPGNRLLKWQLGGAVPVDDRGTLEAIVDGYRTVGLDGAWEGKKSSLRVIAAADGAPYGWSEAGRAIGDRDATTLIASVRGPRFFSLVLALGLFALAPIAMAVARIRGRPRGPEWPFAVGMLTFSALATLAWALLMFGAPDATANVHTGSLAVPLLATAAGAVGFYAVSARLGAAVVALNAAVVLFLYVPSLTPGEGTSYSPVAAVLAALALAAFGLVCLRGASEPDPVTEERDRSNGRAAAVG